MLNDLFIYRKLCLMDDPPEKQNDGKIYALIYKVNNLALLWWSYKLRFEVRVVYISNRKVFWYK